MRGCQEPQVPMLTFVDMDGRVPPDHPLRTIKALADEALRELSSEFDRMYAEVGRPSIPPERLLKASLLIALFSVRSERAFCEELDYNMLYRWFLDMNLLESSFDPTVFTKNRQRLLEHAVGQQLFATVLVGADRHGLLSDEHFTVDGTLIEAAASLKSFKSKGGEPASDDGDPGNPSVDFHEEKRRNKTHQSTTDPEARLFRKGKGKEAKLVFMAHALMENRNGLLTDFQVSEASGTAERDAVPEIGWKKRTPKSDKIERRRCQYERCPSRKIHEGIPPGSSEAGNGREAIIAGGSPPVVPGAIDVRVLGEGTKGRQTGRCRQDVQALD